MESIILLVTITSSFNLQLLEIDYIFTLKDLNCSFSFSFSQLVVWINILTTFIFTLQPL